MMMNHQKMKMNGSDRNSSHCHWNSSAWNQVSTWVIEGWASRPKPTKPMLITQPTYLKAFTGHLFLRVERRTRVSRCE